MLRKPEHANEADSKGQDSDIDIQRFGLKKQKHPSQSQGNSLENVSYKLQWKAKLPKPKQGRAIEEE